MKPKTRYNIRLAERKGVKVRISEDAEALYSLLTKTAGRDKGYTPHPEDYYQKMLATLGPKDLVKIFVAEYQGQPLAAVLVSFFGEVAIYLHGGFDESQRNLMAPYLCQWEAIKYAKLKNCHYYDFWGVAETDDPKDGWAGITRFKDGFGGEKIVLPGSYDLILNSFWYHIFSMVAKIKHIMR
jgi:lipid II:glycine glycyltransferase (peptidoglycan interpeptide bridge formation enzyme)